ncbi:hypothetical protein [Humisphaera borealis]|uniref:Uncharacterized protein n=1 Tax=Humisphaera borealis TaxID=2807512 RepID=A0A7M2WXC9_9BACT|nr:hypothetical protein [Humisphaera borealis]QOV90136.1 hypothetical protein IPV69_01820 [Humisphaera borealis]
MGWLYLLGALVFPPVFILWRPRTPVPPARLKLRFAAAIVVVWMLLMLWSVRASFADDELIETAGLASTQESSAFSTEAPAESTLIVVLGWVPGLVYAGLLSLARKALERPAQEIIETAEWRNVD